MWQSFLVGHPSRNYIKSTRFPQNDPGDRAAVAKKVANFNPL